MKKLIACVVVAFLVCLVMAVPSSADKGAAKKKQNPNLGKLRHVVLFKFKDGTTKEQVKEIEDAFRALPSKIPEIVDFEWGTNNSPEGANRGLTHCFFLTFKNEKDRAVYLPHKEHKKFGAILHPHLDKVVVVDYVAKE